MLLVCLGGCASLASVKGEPYAKLETSLPELPADLGRIYFYRPAGLYGSGIRPDILLNGEKIAESLPGGVYLVDVTPGQYDVSVPAVLYPGAEQLSIEIKAGETRYIRTSAGGSAFAGRINIEQVESDQAKKEIRNLSVINYPR